MFLRIQRNASETFLDDKGAEVFIGIDLGEDNKDIGKAAVGDPNF